MYNLDKRQGNTNGESISFDLFSSAFFSRACIHHGSMPEPSELI